MTNAFGNAFGGSLAYGSSSASGSDLTTGNFSRADRTGDPYLEGYQDAAGNILSESEQFARVRSLGPQYAQAGGFDGAGDFVEPPRLLWPQPLENGLEVRDKREPLTIEDLRRLEIEMVNAGSSSNEPSMSRQALAAAIDSTGQALVQLPAMAADLVGAAVGAGYTTLTGRPADIPMFSAMGRAAENGTGTADLLQSMNPVYAGLIAQYDIRTGLERGDTRPLASFSGSLLGGAVVGAGVGRLPGYVPGSSLTGAAASRLQGRGVPDWNIRVAPYASGTLAANPLPIRLVRVSNVYQGGAYGRLPCGPGMNRLELTKELARRGISDRALSFAPTNDKYSLLQREAKWIVSFTERGIETYLREFDSEDAACQHVLQLLAVSS